MSEAVKPDGEGWIRIGRFDRAKRRSLWVRVHQREGEPVTAFELCSGREGRDSAARIDSMDPSFAALWDVLSTQLWSQGT